MSSPESATVQKTIPVHYETFKQNAIMKEMILLARAKNKKIVNLRGPETDTNKDIYDASQLSDEPYERFENKAVLRAVKRLEVRLGVHPGTTTDLSAEEKYANLLKNIAVRSSG
jgi:hypothetical protein